MNIRLLESNDYNQYLELINHFRETKFNKHQFDNFLENEINIKIYVIEQNNILIGSGTILLEKKFIHNISLYAHIEDIIIRKEFRKNGYGKELILYLINICRFKRCYKILLDCETKLIPFYEKCGFTDKGHQMIIYL